MGKKFNLKSGNCPSFKEMGGDSPFNQDAKGLKEAEEMKQMTSTVGQASEIPGGHGSRSTRKFKRTNEDLPEQV